MRVEVTERDQTSQVILVGQLELGLVSLSKAKLNKNEMKTVHYELN